MSKVVGWEREWHGGAEWEWKHAPRAVGSGKNTMFRQSARGKDQSSGVKMNDGRWTTTSRPVMQGRLRGTDRPTDDEFAAAGRKNPTVNHTVGTWKARCVLRARARVLQQVRSLCRMDAAISIGTGRSDRDSEPGRA